jgi:hypothetical protein
LGENVIGAGERPDYIRNFQVGVAQIVVLFYALLLVPVGYSGYKLLFGEVRNVSNNVTRWVVWGVAFLPLSGAVVAAIKLFGSRADRRRSWRLVAWAAGALRCRHRLDRWRVAHQ